MSKSLTKVLLNLCAAIFSAIALAIMTLPVILLQPSVIEKTLMDRVDTPQNRQRIKKEIIEKAELELASIVPGEVKTYLKKNVKFPASLLLASRKKQWIESYISMRAIDFAITLLQKQTFLPQLKPKPKPVTTINDYAICINWIKEGRAFCLAELRIILTGQGFDASKPKIADGAKQLSEFIRLEITRAAAFWHSEITSSLIYTLSSYSNELSAEEYLAIQEYVAISSIPNLPKKLESLDNFSKKLPLEIKNKTPFIIELTKLVDIMINDLKRTLRFLR